MPLLNFVASWFLKKRNHQIDLFYKYPHEVQQEWLEKLVKSALDTEWGRSYNFEKISSYDDFKINVPLNDYESLSPFIERMMAGEEDLLWPGRVRWFAKSSGTTNAKSKFIPVTDESLEDCHYKAGKDMLAIYYNMHPDSEILDGKAIGVAGSSRLQESTDSYIGDLSAILMNNLPLWAQFTKTPNLDISLMENWDKKVELIAQHTIDDDVRLISGVPSWMLVILHKVLEVSGKEKIQEVWPNFELIIHGGVSMLPYMDRFKKITDPKTRYLEVYNASEGFLALQDEAQRDDMLLMLDYGIYFEFMPMSEYGSENPNVVNLESVQLDTNYAMIITTNAGLWRYIIGDTVVFTSKCPYRIKISGRVKAFINVVGEEVMVDNTDKAIKMACDHNGALVNEYSAAPFFDEVTTTIYHEWVIEFDQAPANFEMFCESLDNALKAHNSDYEAKRFKDMILKTPVVHNAPKGTFHEWLRSKGKLGGQFKVPRLSNDRKMVDELINIIKDVKK